MMRVSVIGAGYVGLVTSACLADLGHEVVCVDVDPGRVRAIREGRAPMFEAGLDAVLARNAGTRLHASSDLEAAVRGSEITLIAVGTPLVGGEIDLRSVEGAARQIGAALRRSDAYHVVAVKSTVVPGTTDGTVRRALEEASGRTAGEGFGLGVNPEFLTEGEAVGDFTDPDRIVIGGIDERTREALSRLHEVFPGVATLRTTNATAEMIKYASNALLATLISFSNELANLGACIGGIDTVDVSKGVVLSRYLTTRSGPEGSQTASLAEFLQAGCGFGGSCLPKDVTALVAQGRALGQPMRVLEAALDVNRDQPGEVIRLLRRHFPDLSGVRVALLGLAFRPDTSDTRESPAIPIVRALEGLGACVRAYDPVVREEAAPVFGAGLRICSSLAEALDGCAAAVLVTRWSEFEALPGVLAMMESPPLLVDGRRMLDPGSVPRYEGIGR